MSLCGFLMLCCLVSGKKTKISWKSLLDSTSFLRPKKDGKPRRRKPTPRRRRGKGGEKKPPRPAFGQTWSLDGSKNQSGNNMRDTVRIDEDTPSVISTESPKKLRQLQGASWASANRIWRDCEFYACRKLCVPDLSRLAGQRSGWFQADRLEVTPFWKIPVQKADIPWGTRSDTGGMPSWSRTIFIPCYDYVEWI